MHVSDMFAGQERAVAEILSYLDRRREALKKDTEFSIIKRRMTKLLALRSSRLATYAGQLKSLPEGVNPEIINRRIRDANLPPIELS